MFVGTTDRVIRIVLDLALLSAIVLPDGCERRFGLIGIVLLWTAVARCRLLYTVLGLRTSPAPML